MSSDGTDRPETLEQLLDQWREKADELIHEGENSYMEGRGGQLAECARQLERYEGTGVDREMSGTERYAKVDVIAPDGSREDSVKVQFGREQLIGIDPEKHEGLGVRHNEYRLKLRHIVIDGERHLSAETSQEDL